jgi:DNA-binding response OmpR family regulator
MAKILIADDERDIRDLVAFALRFAGYEVLTTSNGEEAVRAVLEDAPDLILLDVRMPRMTGYEACRLIKEQPGTQDIPIVFLSAKGQEAEVNAGLQLGAVEYIVKPFSPDDLLMRVKAILGNHRT